MNKKLIAVAVAGLFAAPVVAFAQSSVTITGKAVASFGQYKVSGRPAGATGSNSETQVRDESSTLIFLMREDLGGGLAAIAKYDLRPTVDAGGLGGTGEAYVGLTSTSWGTIGLGRYPLHYGNHASFTGVHSGLMSNPTALFDRANVGTRSIARQSRLDNVVRYGSPKFADMFEIVAAYSTTGHGEGTAEADLRSTTRKGSSWNLNPKVWGKNWEVGYSYWTAKPEGSSVAAAGTFAKQRSDSLYGWYMWGGLRVGLAWNRSRVNETVIATQVDTQISKRSVWGIPISYNWGNHTIYGDFYRAGRDSAAQYAGLDTKARFVGVTYAYDLSKRTAIALSYAGIRNGAAAQYNLFTGNGAPTTTTSGLAAAGEDPSTWTVTLGHRF